MNFKQLKDLTYAIHYFICRNVRTRFCNRLCNSYD